MAARSRSQVESRGKKVRVRAHTSRGRRVKAHMRTIGGRVGGEARRHGVRTALGAGVGALGGMALATSRGRAIAGMAGVTVRGAGRAIGFASKGAKRPAVRKGVSLAGAGVHAVGRGFSRATRASTDSLVGIGAGLGAARAYQVSRKKKRRRR